MYASLTTLKEYLGLLEPNETGHDQLLNRLLTAATNTIEATTNRVFNASTTTTHGFDAEDLQDGELWLDGDLAELVSVTNGDGSALDLATVRTIPRNSTPFHGLRSTYLACTDDQSLLVAGKWGYSTTPPAAIEQACVRLAGYWYRLKDAQVFDVTANPETGQLAIPKGLPADVKHLLEPYVRLL